MTKESIGIVTPFIHMNGTSPAGLRKPLEEAYSKLNEAYDAIKQCAPNGRDYYPYHEYHQVLGKATEQHMDRLRRIDSIKSEIEEIIGHIDDMAEAVQ